MVVSYVAKWFIRLKEKSFFILELPIYRAPRWNNVVVTMINKAKIFVVDAGKVIMVISLVLWGLSSFGPGRRSEVAARFDEQIRLHPDTDFADVRAPNASSGASLFIVFPWRLEPRSTPTAEPRQRHPRRAPAMAGSSGFDGGHQGCGPGDPVAGFTRGANVPTTGAAASTTGAAKIPRSPRTSDRHARSPG